ncbi:hypothetical protein BAU15_14110 [Enterococcus sp. JM4C]|uniref:GNAT family N-acetyltransferase n=1 Tax=Candidatus Enterococcus huntleyi TaxID=1857217 RepID=UPI00137B4FEC|nr:GNAT family N-acetyltransferase [Enterococcus sp. JM4C]KAF1296002.1 hypothetical protein BAU15_14110 [Enterococcus sp. JM4C]
MIVLERTKEEEIEKVYALQKVAFQELYNKYQDEGSPFHEPISSIQEKYNRPDNYFFTINDQNDNTIGYIRVVIDEAQQQGWLAQIAIDPSCDNKGYGTRAIELVEEIFSSIKEWSLSTILQEEKLVHFYSKIGYEKAANIQNIQEDMDIVFFKKRNQLVI